MCFNYRYNLDFIQLQVLKEIDCLLRIPDKFSCLFLFAIVGSNRRDAKGTQEEKRRVKQTFVSDPSYLCSFSCLFPLKDSINYKTSIMFAQQLEFCFWGFFFCLFVFVKLHLKIRSSAFFAVTNLLNKNLPVDGNKS